MHIFVDITNVKKLEEEKAKIKCQNIMLASVSHEFRTPLNAFGNSLQLIKLKVDELISLARLKIEEPKTNFKLDAIDFEISKFLKIGNISSKLLMHLVEDILDLGKFEAGTFSLNNSEFTVLEIIEDMTFMFKNQCEMKGLEFIVEAQEEMIRKKFISDHCRIKQVLINLISNSLKFTQNGSIKITIEEVRERKDIQLKFTILDTGVGIQQKDQQKLFQMFSMLDQHKSKLNQKGTGIGLAISKKIANSLKGDIRVESEVNKYTKFEFMLKVGCSVK
jgi:signal transduction histidine kinase